MYPERLTYQLRRRVAGICVKRIRKDVKKGNQLESIPVRLMASKSVVIHREAEQ